MANSLFLRSLRPPVLVRPYRSRCKNRNRSCKYLPCEPEQVALPIYLQKKRWDRSDCEILSFRRTSFVAVSTVRRVFVNTRENIGGALHKRVTQ